MACARCETLTAEIDNIRLAASIDLENLQAKYLVELRRVGALKAQLEGEAGKTKDSEVVKRVCAHWKKALGHPKAKTPAGGARWQKVQARLNEGFTEEQIVKAIDGCARKPFVGPGGRYADAGPGRKRFDDIELICRDETYVDKFMGYADEPDEPAQVVPIKPKPRPRESDWSYARNDPEDSVLGALEEKGCHPVAKGNGWQALCPNHDDRNPSLSINWNGDGSRLLVHCWAGCETVYVMEALEKPLSCLFRSERAA